jgi:CIC family chloride channel protein
MGAVFAGVVRTPMTSVLMIFETTRDYAVIVPLMISNLVSLFISSRLQPRTIYDALSLQDGIHLPAAETRDQQGRHLAGKAMRPATEILSADMTIRDALDRIQSSELPAWPVEDQRGMIGVVNRAMLEREFASGAPEKHLREILNPRDFPHVHSDHSLDLALTRMGAAQLELLPVVSRADIHKLEGVITLRDILKSYGVGPPNPS